MTHKVKHVDEPRPVPDTPVPPLPPIELNTVWDVAKIIIFVMVWYICSDANHALTAAVDYAKLGAPATGTGISMVPSITWVGAKVGLLQGAIMSIQALVTIWAGPIVFTYLGPVLVAAFRTPINLVVEFRRAWTAKPRDDSGDKK